ncbi:MAG TPA: NUDIX domain-containing protein, partial [Anaerolineales bacterium]
MSYRAAILLLQDDKIALIERQRAGLHYFTFPGGHVEEGETPEQAAVREAAEELGLQVVIKKMLVRMGWQ